MNFKLTSSNSAAKPSVLIVLVLVVATACIYSCEYSAPNDGSTSGTPDDIINSVPTLNRFTFTNTESDSVAILIDGRFYGRVINDSALSQEGLSLEIEDFNNANLSNELIAFTANRRPLILENIDWESNLDTTLRFQSPVTLPLSAWVIYKGNVNFEYQKGRIVRAVADCNAIFAHEGVGIQFEVTVRDASTYPGIKSHYDISTSSDMDEIDDLLDGDEDRINLFFTKTVAGDPQRAFTTFWIRNNDEDNRIAFGMHAVDGGIIAHEIGHNFSLLHADSERSSAQNVMADIASPIRIYFTEGQLYRMWFSQITALRTVYRLEIQSRDQSEIHTPNTYLDVWGIVQGPPYIDLYFDNDSIW